MRSGFKRDNRRTKLSNTMVQGIQFVTTKLGGLVLSVELGNSFVIQRLGNDAQGKALWSGPCFGTISNVGVGVTAGAVLSDMRQKPAGLND